MRLGWVCLVAGVAGAAPEDSRFNPRTLGPNAVPAIAGDSPWPRAGIVSGVGVTVQRHVSDVGGVDTAVTLPLFLAVPIGTRAEVFSYGNAFEAFWLSPQTQSGWGLQRASGVVQADTSIGAKFLMLGDDDYGLGFRLIIKTTTGKGRALRRHLDAPGYVFDIPFARRWRFSSTLHLELGGAIGFFAWQQPDGAQNDAYSYSMRSVLTSPAATLGVELRGYVGWQRGDKPITLAAWAELWPTKAVGVVVKAAQTIQHPVVSELSLGLRLALPALFTP